MPDAIRTKSTELAVDLLKGSLPLGSLADTLTRQRSSGQEWEPELDRVAARLGFLVKAVAMEIEGYIR